MNQPYKLPTQPWKVFTAAALLAVAQSSAVAQEPGGFGPGAEPETQQQERPGGAFDEPTQQDEPGGFDDPQQQDEPGGFDDPQQQDEPGAFDDPQQQDEPTAEVDREQLEQQLDELVQQHGNLSTFVEAIKTAGMEDSLLGGTTYTIFAPIDEAFEEMDIEDLLRSENWEEVADMLRAHIVADDVDPETARQIQRAMTLDGDSVELTEREGQLNVADATVVEDDFQIGNVRIYPIDRMLSGPTAGRALGD